MKNLLRADLGALLFSDNPLATPPRLLHRRGEPAAECVVQGAVLNSFKINTDMKGNSVLWSTGEAPEVAPMLK